MVLPKFPISTAYGVMDTDTAKTRRRTGGYGRQGRDDVPAPAFVLQPVPAGRDCFLSRKHRPRRNFVSRLLTSPYQEYLNTPVSSLPGGHDLLIKGFTIPNGGYVDHFRRNTFILQATRDRLGTGDRSGEIHQHMPVLGHVRGEQTGMPDNFNEATMPSLKIGYLPQHSPITRVQRRRSKVKLDDSDRLSHRRMPMNRRRSAGNSGDHPAVATDDNRPASLEASNHGDARGGAADHDRPASHSRAARDADNSLRNKRLRPCRALHLGRTRHHTAVGMGGRLVKRRGIGGQVWLGRHGFHGFGGKRRCGRFAAVGSASIFGLRATA